MSRYTAGIIARRKKEEEDSKNLSIPEPIERDFKKDKWLVIEYDNKKRENEIGRVEYKKVSEAIKVLGISRTTFYKYYKAGDGGGKIKVEKL